MREAPIISTMAVILQFIHVSKWHVIHLKLCDVICQMYFNNKKMLNERITKKILLGKANSDMQAIHSG